MNKSESIKTIAGILHKIQQTEDLTCHRNAHNPFHKKHYADIGEVWRVVKATVTRYGITVIQTPEVIDNQITVETTLFHVETGEWISCSSPSTSST